MNGKYKDTLDGLIKALVFQIGEELETLVKMQDEAMDKGGDISYHIDPVFIVSMHHPKSRTSKYIGLRVPMNGVGGNKKGTFQCTHPPDAIYFVDDDGALCYQKFGQDDS